jgi:hypothetical protein
MQSNYEEAVDVLKNAQDQFIEIGDQLGAAQCSQSLGDILPSPASGLALKGLAGLGSGL